MILVMPWGHAVPFDGPQDRNSELFERHLLNEILPDIERRYRTSPGRQHRAIVGLSMGGGQALRIGLGHLDRFSAIAAFSTAVPSDFSTRFQSLLTDPAETNRKLKLLWIGCGRQDPAFQRNQQLAELLSTHQVRVTFRETDGLHNFSLWRRHLVEVVPLLFSGE
jgi:enterochelin esterase family protein